MFYLKSNKNMLLDAEDTRLHGRITTESVASVARDDALGGRIDTLEAELSTGIAMSLAMQAPSVSPGKRLGLSLGVGSYNGETAIAFSVRSRISDRVSLNGGIGFGLSTRNSGARIGVTYAF